VKHSENIQPDEIDTTAVFRKAEPGRDIFAANVEKDGKSSSHLPPQGTKEEEKLISSVGVDAGSKDDGNGFIFQESKPIVISTKSSSATESTSAVSVASSESVVEVKRPKGQAGPLGEAQAEAQKAAEELFPDR